MREAAYLTVALMKSCKSIFNVGKKESFDFSEYICVLESILGFF